MNSNTLEISTIDKSNAIDDIGFIDLDLEDPKTGFPVTRDEMVQVTFIDGVKTCLYIS